MPQSLAKIIVHIVFGTKNQRPFLSPNIRDNLFAYIGGILNKIDSTPILIGGVEDHVHILCLLSKNLPPCKLIEKVKSASSKWIKSKNSACKGFQWQNGYAIFSVSNSSLPSVRDYISTQNEHHRKTSFKGELKHFLEKYDLQYDEKYIWD